MSTRPREPYPSKVPEGGQQGVTDMTMPQGKVRVLGPSPGGGKTRVIEGLKPSTKDAVG